MKSIDDIFGWNVIWESFPKNLCVTSQTTDHVTNSFFLHTNFVAHQKVTTGQTSKVQKMCK